MIVMYFPGACHSDEVGYLFKNIRGPEVKPGSVEDYLIRVLIKLWANFARHGNPTPEISSDFKWKAVEKHLLNYLDIGNQIKSNINPEYERMLLWREFYHFSSNTMEFL